MLMGGSYASPNPLYEHVTLPGAGLEGAKGDGVVKAAKPEVADKNFFTCLLCDAQANANTEKVRAGAYGVRVDPDGSARFIGICAYCKSIGYAYQQRKNRKDSVALDLLELHDLAARLRRRGMSVDVARKMAVEQQVRAEDIPYVEFMEWLHKHGRL